MANNTERALRNFNFVLRGVVVGLAAIIPARMWVSHSSFAFGMGLMAGVVLQHFIPPRGRLKDLLIPLLVAALGALVVVEWTLIR